MNKRRGELDLSRMLLPVEVTMEDPESTQVEDHKIYQRHETQTGEPCAANDAPPTSERQA